ncbi:MAG: MFS transporter, partial [Ktedonobacterales bacterium]|nr:MFS transporter [Ktedonobacterales bacterium]
LVGDIFVPAERARWQGLFTAVFALASVVGPTLGGWITDNASWRWVFYVNLPVGALALFAIIAWLPSNISVRGTQARGFAAFRRIDFAGALTAAGATAALLLGLTWGGATYAWNSPRVIGVLTAAGVLFGTFFIIERFFAHEPILPLDLFKSRIFAVGSLLSLAVGMALFAVIIYLPLFIQAVLGQSATSAGAVITPLTLTLALGATLVGQLIARIGRYQFLSVIGASILAFGVYLLARMDATTGLGEVTRNMIVVGLGLGMLQPVLTLAVQNAIPRSRLGVGTGAVTYLRAMGQTLGVALIGSVVNNTVSGQLATRLPAAARALPAKALAAVTNQQVLVNPQYRGEVSRQVIQAAVARAVPPAVARATAAVAPGPGYAERVAAVAAQVRATVTAQVTAQVTTLLHGIFESTRQALAVGITAAFWVSLFVCGAIVVLTLFLKDVPLIKSFAPTPAVAATGNAPTGEMRVGAPGVGLGAVPVGAAAAPGRPSGSPGFTETPGFGGARLDVATPRAGSALTARHAESRRRLALAGVVLAALADEAQREDANPTLLAGLAALADGRYSHVWREEDRGRAIARDLLEPMALTALRAAYGDRLPEPARATEPARAPRRETVPLAEQDGRDGDTANGGHIWTPASAPADARHDDPRAEEDAINGRFTPSAR